MDKEVFESARAAYGNWRDWTNHFKKIAFVGHGGSQVLSGFEQPTCIIKTKIVFKQYAW